MPEQPQGPAEPPAPAPEPFRILVPSPLGQLGIELTGERITGVVIVPKGAARKTYTPLAKLKRSQRSDFLDEVLGRFSEYFANARRNLELDYDLAGFGLDRFSRRVFKETGKIPYGRTRTYQDVAAATGRPDAYRRVRSTLLTNPLPLVVPCHRVVPSRSGSGDYVAGARKKEWLLKLEQRTTIAL